jgi:hypothetical protein
MMTTQIRCAEERVEGGGGGRAERGLSYIFDECDLGLMCLQVKNSAITINHRILKMFLLKIQAIHGHVQRKLIIHVLHNMHKFNTQNQLKNQYFFFNFHLKLFHAM